MNAIRCLPSLRSILVYVTLLIGHSIIIRSRFTLPFVFLASASLSGLPAMVSLLRRHGDAAVEDKDYPIGDFSAADTILGHAAVMSNRLGCVSDEMANLKAYTARLEARPAFKKADSVH